MHISNLKLTNFRNYKKVNIDFSPDTVFVCGKNASGKTNLIESIYYLSNLHSFRAADPNLINKSEDYFSASSLVGLERFEVVVQKNPVLRRVFKVNDQKVKKIAWTSFPVVLFSPTDLNIFILGPEARRRFLNDILLEKDRAYSLDLNFLEHILKQRKALLQRLFKAEASYDELEFWNKELAIITVRISKARRMLLEHINDRFTGIYRELTGFDTVYEVIYKGLGEGVDESGFLEKLRSHQDLEIRTQANLFGPHRDDFLIYKDGVMNTLNSSRGELREQVLAMKMVHAHYVSTPNKKPIVLLDDVFSELDEERKARLLSGFLGFQVFITTTETVDPSPKAQIIFAEGNSLIIKQGP
jgi:DNA replication and repair protein RecF